MDEAKDDTDQCSYGDYPPSAQLLQLITPRYLCPDAFGLHRVRSAFSFLPQQFQIPPGAEVGFVLHCMASHASRTATISPIDQSLSVTPAAIAGATRPQGLVKTEALPLL
jgi:hypothetical protein